MDIQTLTTVFMWCTVIDVALFAVAAIFLMVAADFVYRIQNGMFPIPRDTYNVVMYGFLGAFKLIILVFNVVPFVALLIVG